MSMSHEEWTTFDSYADRVTVVVTPVEHPSTVDNATEEWLLISDGAAWTPEWLRKEVEALAVSANELGAPVTAPYVLKVDHERFSWGADATTIQYVLLLAQWAASNAAWDGLKNLAGAMRARLNRDSEAQFQPLTDQEAVTRTLWLIEARYREDPTCLTVTSVEVTNACEAIVIATNSSGWTYECELLSQGGLVTTSRVKRALASP